MALSQEKSRRLENIARLYYEQGRTQEEISREVGVSRPLISRLLQEAREVGIVEIRVRSLHERSNTSLSQVKNLFGLRGGVLLPQNGGDSHANENLAQCCQDYMRSLGGGRLGLGWGPVVGALVKILEARVPQKSFITNVCPLVGNSGISIRYYHSNENVRIVAHHILANPHYLHTPAFAETRQELELLRQTENYKAVSREWDMLDIALVNIGNYPSSPDFASTARYGNLLAERRAVGRLIAYYYTADGEILQADTDYAIQIPIASLRRSRHVIGVCPSNCRPEALLGALRTGMLSHIIATAELAGKVLAMAATEIPQLHL